MTINPDNVRRVIRRDRRTAWLTRNGGMLALAAFTVCCMVGLVILMVTPR